MRFCGSVRDTCFWRDAPGAAIVGNKSLNVILANVWIRISLAVFLGSVVSVLCYVLTGK